MWRFEYRNWRVGFMLVVNYFSYNFDAWAGHRFIKGYTPTIFLASLMARSATARLWYG